MLPGGFWYPDWWTAWRYGSGPCWLFYCIYLIHPFPSDNFTDHCPPASLHTKPYEEAAILCCESDLHTMHTHKESILSSEILPWRGHLLSTEWLCQQATVIERTCLKWDYAVQRGIKLDEGLRTVDLFSALRHVCKVTLRQCATCRTPGMGFSQWHRWAEACFA